MNFVPRLIPSLLLVSLLTSSGAIPPGDVFGIVAQARNASFSYAQSLPERRSTMEIRSQPPLMAR
jgi:hypothetical protein